RPTMLGHPPDPPDTPPRRSRNRPSRPTATPGSSPEIPFRPTVRRHDDRHRTVAFELDPHVGAEPAGGHVRVRAAQHAAEGVEETASSIWWRGVREIRTPAAPYVAIQRELRDHEHAARDVEHSAVELAVIVV